MASGTGGTLAAGASSASAETAARSCDVPETARDLGIAAAASGSAAGAATVSTIVSRGGTAVRRRMRAVTGSSAVMRPGGRYAQGWRRWHGLNKPSKQSATVSRAKNQTGTLRVRLHRRAHRPRIRSSFLYMSRDATEAARRRLDATRCRGYSIGRPLHPPSSRRPRRHRDRIWFQMGTRLPRNPAGFVAESRIGARPEHRRLALGPLGSGFQGPSAGLHLRRELQERGSIRTHSFAERFQRLRRSRRLAGRPGTWNSGVKAAPTRS